MNTGAPAPSGPCSAYTPESNACAIANVGSSSIARLRCGIASRRGTSTPPDSASEYAWSASSDAVVARGSGTSNFWIEASDSPSFSRSLEVAAPSDVSTSSLLAASACSRAITSPVSALIASSVEHVVASEARDRTGEQRLQLLAPRDLARDRARDALVRRTLHQPQRLAHPLVRKDLQERRLLQRDGQRHLQRAVEHRSRRSCSRNRRARWCPARSACVRRGRRRTTTRPPGCRRQPPARPRRSTAVSHASRPQRPRCRRRTEVRQACRHLGRRRGPLGGIARERLR